MQGSVRGRKRRRKDGTTYMVIRAQIRRPDGKGNIERTFSAPEYGTTANARAAANEWLRAQVTAISENKWRDPDVGAVLLSDVCNQWLQAKSAKWAPKTIAGYHNIVKVHILPRSEERRVGKECR